MIILILNFTSDGQISIESINYEGDRSSNNFIQSLSGVKVLYIYSSLYDTPYRLQSLGASVFQVHVSSLGNISSDSLCKYDLVLVDIGAIWHTNVVNLGPNLQNYVLIGGGYWINQPNQPGNVPTLPPTFSVNISSNWWNCGTSSCQSFTPLAPSHPITSGLDINLTSGDYDIQGPYSNNWSVLIVDNSHGPNDPTLMVGNYGSGRLVYTDHCLSFSCVDPGDNSYLERIAKWLALGSCGTFTPVSQDESVKLPGDKFYISSNSINLHLINKRNVKYEIYTTYGRLISSKNIGELEPGKYSYTINIKPGTYILRIYLDNQNYTKSFFVY